MPFLNRYLWVFPCLFLAGCSAPNEEYVFLGNTMGTSWSVKVTTDAKLDSAVLRNEIQSLMDEVNAKMSNWVVDSEVSQFNMGAAGCYAISQDTAKVVSASLSISQATNGVFDVTAGPLIELWGFGTDFGVDQSPDLADIQLQMANIGYEKIRLEDNELCKDIDQLSINLSATAKGYGVDLVADYLEQKSLNNYLVEIGGELRVSGFNLSGSQWRVGIETPSDYGFVDSAGRTVQEVIEISDHALATSGDYRNFFIDQGVRYSHVIDPRSGYPILQDVASVTVIHSSALWADGWATALLAVGPERAMQLAEEHNLAVYMVLRSEQGFEVLTSTQWAF